MTKQQFLSHCLSVYGTATDGVYPAYHMNKLHWISVLLPDAPADTARFLAGVSFEVTRAKPARKKTR